MLDIMDTAGQVPLSAAHFGFLASPLVGGVSCLARPVHEDRQRKNRILCCIHLIVMFQGFVLVYSITSQTSFEAASKLRGEILKIKEDYPDVRVL